MGTLTTIPKSTLGPMAGIDYFLVTNFAEVIPTIDASGYATFAEGDSSVADAFVKFKPTKETSGWNAPATGTPATGAISYMHTANMVFSKNDITNRNNLKEIGESEVFVVAVMRNNTQWLLGDSYNGLDLTAGMPDSGVAPNDVNGITMTLTQSCEAPPAMITDVELALIQPS